MKTIDLRSDTVTDQPEEMKQAMLHATVGDDVYDDDPSVRELEEYAAKLLNFEKALFVPSGTFANQLSIFTHCQPGNEIILAESSHIIIHEAGAAAAISSVQTRFYDIENKTILLDSISKRIRTEDLHYPKTALICMENPMSDGYVLSLSNMNDVYQLAKSHHIPVHLDGARIFNAAAHLGCEAKDFSTCCDTMMFCLSKGLCAPVGSVLLGSEKFIARAKKKRKVMGGALRQSGYLAAAGLYALKHLRERIFEDNENATYLAQLIKKIPNTEVCMDQLDVNMIFIKWNNDIMDGKKFTEKMLEYGIKLNPPEGDYLRMVCTYWTKKEDLDYVYDKMCTILKA